MKTIAINDKPYDLYWFTGTVAEANKNLETRVHGGGGGGYTNRGSGYTAPVSISSTTIVHDQIFLVDKNGEERSLRLENWDVSCRTGHEITAFWLIEKGKNNGPYVVLYNHNLRGKNFNDKVLAKYFKFKMQNVILITMAASFVLMWMISGHFVAAFSSVFFSAILGWLIWRGLTNKSALNRFKESFDPGEYR